jgi:lactate dehydrogenase-like 2-hydroxyacid dehydrogenase
MKNVKILVTDTIVHRMPDITAEKYPEENAHIEWVLAETGDEEELVRLVKDVDIIVGARHPIKTKILENADNVFFIQQCSAGYDNLDLDTARKKSITVSHSGSAGIIPVAELVMTLMLSAARSIPKCHNSMANGEWIFPEMINKTYEVNAKTLGIIGMGKIGTQTATLANGLQMKIQYFDPYRKDTSDLDFPAKSVSLEELLKTSDFISIHTLMTDETFHMIGKNELEMMKPTAYLINTSRGSICDEDALADALENNVIAGAGLDVFGGHHEPPSEGAKILKLDNVVLTPHIGGATAEDIYRNFFVTSLDNIIRVIRGEEPLYIVS